MATQPHIIGIGGTLREQSRSLAALKYTLDAAAAVGATTTLFDLSALELPMFRPRTNLEDYGENVAALVNGMRTAQGIIISTGAYHGSMAGVTKNAIDFAEFLADSTPAYWDQKAVALIATAGGVNAAPNTITAMVNCVHALRGFAIPLYAAIKQAGKVVDREGNIIDEGWASRLGKMGHMVVDLATKLNPVPASDTMQS